MRIAFLLLLSLCLLPMAMGQNIFIVTDDPHLEVEGAGNLGDYLRSLGYSVTVDEGNPDQSDSSNSKYRGELTDEEIAHLESFDLVIVHRSTSSGSFYNNGVTEQWNLLDVPMLCGSAYLPRSSRWMWVEGSEQRTIATSIDIVIEDHPIVAGLTGEFYDTDLDIDHLAPGDVGEGTIVATIVNSSGVEAPAIVVWDTDDFFYSIQDHVAPRVFIPLARYHEDDFEGSFENYTQNGLQLIAQAVSYTISLGGTNVPDWTLH